MGGGDSKLFGKMRVVKSIPGGGKAYSGAGVGVWGKAGSKVKDLFKGPWWKATWKPNVSQPN